MSGRQTTAPEIEITRLANGLRVVTEAMPHVGTATLGLWVAAGSRHEREAEHGLSHLIEHMAFKGTARRSARQIAEAIENVGGDINAATSTEFTSYTARVLGADVALAIDVLGDILTQSVFDTQELAREKNVILQEYAAAQDSPDDLVTDAFIETAFAGQAIGRPILGHPETIMALDGAAIAAFMAREYLPERMVLAVAGEVDHARVVEAAQAAFGGLVSHPSHEPAAGRYIGGETRISRRLGQASITLGLPGVSFRDPAYFSTQMFAHVLGGGLTSRLWHEVRETRGLAYAIEAFHWPFSDCGVFGISAATGPEDLRELIDVTGEAVVRATRDIAPEELARAKAQLKVSLLASLETPGGRIERNARQLLAWDRLIPGEEILARVDAVDVDAVREAGARLLAGPPTLAAIGPIRSLPTLPRVSALLQSQPVSLSKKARSRLH